MVADLEAAGLGGAGTETERYLRVAILRYLLLHTNEWSDDIVERLAEEIRDRAPRTTRWSTRSSRRWTEALHRRRFGSGPDHTSGPGTFVRWHMEDTGGLPAVAAGALAPTPTEG